MDDHALKDGPGGLRGLAFAWEQRPLAAAALGLAVGVAVGRHAALPAPLGWALAALCLAVFLRRLGRPLLRGLAVWAFLTGLAAGAARVQPLRAALEAAPRPSQAALRLRARLLADEGERPATRRHAFLVEALALDPLDPLDPQAPPPPLPLRLRLSADLRASEAWRPGDTVELYGTFREPERPHNPGEFDYRALLLGRGIQGLFSQRGGWPSGVAAAGAPWLPARLLERLRRRLEAGLAAGLDARAQVLARSIVLGDRAGLSREDHSDFARSGFAHILAVSGAHFSLVLGLILLAARALSGSRRRQALLGLALGLGYALLTGFGAPVQRAFALVFVWLAARALDWECESVTSLAAGALAILLVQPGALWEAGLQLSFGCTLAILLIAPPVAGRLPPLWPRWLRLALGGLAALQLALLPLLAYHFRQLCWPGLAASLASGAFTAGILGLGLPLALLGAWLPGAAALLGWPLGRLLALLDASATWMAHWPGAVYSTGLIAAWIPLAAVAWGVAFLFYAGPWRRGLLGASAVFLFGALLWQGLPFRHRHPGETRLWMLDIGQGDSLLLEFGDGRHLLVDGGPGAPDAGAWVVVPALRALGIQGLDWALATHADADHVGGLAWVLDQVPVGVLLGNGLDGSTRTWRAVAEAAARRGVPQRALSAAIPRRPDDGPWEVLNPLPPRPVRRTKKPRRKPRVHNNDASVVLRVEGWLLLTGDLPKAGEKRLLKRGLGPVEVLKAGHHGSRGSSGPAFVEALRPKEALISCGRANRYSHPTPQALAALASARLWRTDLQGCVALRRRADGPLDIRPWLEADEAALRRPAPRYRSPWRPFGAEKARAWAAFRARAAADDGDDDGPPDGDEP